MADQGDAEAQVNLGSAHVVGRGTQVVASCQVHLARPAARRRVPARRDEPDSRLRTTRLLEGAAFGRRPRGGVGSAVLSCERPPSQAEEQRGTPARRPGGAAQEHLFDSVVPDLSL